MTAGNLMITAYVADTSTFVGVSEPISGLPVSI